MESKPKYETAHPTRSCPYCGFVHMAADAMRVKLGKVLRTNCYREFPDNPDSASSK